MTGSAESRTFGDAPDVWRLMSVSPSGQAEECGPERRSRPGCVNLKRIHSDGRSDLAPRGVSICGVGLRGGYVGVCLPVRCSKGVNCRPRSSGATSAKWTTESAMPSLTSGLPALAWTGGKGR